MTEKDEQNAEPSGDGAPNAEDQAPAPVGVPSTPEEKIAALERERVDLRDRMLRIAAEFENWKKRARRENAEAEAKAKEAVLRDMLEVADNLERATSSWGENPDPKGVQQGVMLVLRQFQSKLERYGVQAIEAKGQPFDPRIHDAISQIPSADVPPGTVLNELQKGYRIGERLLRPASVVVAVAPPAAETNGSGETPEPNGGDHGNGGVESGD